MDDKPQFSGEELSYLSELRDMARRGDDIPLMGSALYVLWGWAIAAGSIVHMVLLVIEADTAVITLIWAITTMVASVGTFVFVRRISVNPLSSAHRNLSSAFGWAIGGAVPIVFFLIGWLVRPEIMVLTPALTGYVFAIVMAFSAVISRVRLLRFFSIGWMVFASIYLIVSIPLVQVTLMLSAAIALLVVPGVLLKRMERD